MSYNKKSFLLSALTLGLLTSSLQPGIVNASKEADSSNSDLVVEETPSENISKENGTTYHIVRKGETVFSISKKYDVSEEALKFWNNISNNIIHVNQVLSVNGVNVYQDFIKETNHFTTTQQFINRVAPIALEVAGKYELYPSVMIAQAIHESASGTSELAVLANNYFGIKRTYKGMSIYKMSPEEVNGNFVNQSSRFRLYPDLYSSVEDNGKRLRLGPNEDSEDTPWNNTNYNETWVENAFTYRDATQGLVNGGYATDSKYALKLNNIIDRYNLIEYDKQLYDFIDEREQYVAAAPARNFVAGVNALPNVSEIQKMTFAELSQLVETLNVMRASYDQLIASDKLRANVVTWENNLRLKEEATQKALSEVVPEATPIEKPSESIQTSSTPTQLVGQEFIVAVRNLPNISEIDKMDANQLDSSQNEMAAVRSLYNKLTSTEQANSEVARWEGYLLVKESRVSELVVTIEDFISAVRALPNVSEIEAMNNSQLNSLKNEIIAASSLFNALSSSKQVNPEVARWAGYLTTKEEVVESNLKTEDFTEKIDAFVSAARKLPLISEIEKMNSSQLKALQVEMASVRALSRVVPSSAMSNPEVARWESYLSEKEVKATNVLNRNTEFISKVKSLPKVSEIEKMNERQLLTLEKEFSSVRSLFNTLSVPMQKEVEIARWAGYLTEKEEAVEFLLFSDQIFIKAGRGLPNLSAIEKMNNRQLNTLEKELKTVRALYNSLPSRSKSIPEVILWEGYLSQKENTLVEQFKINEAQEAVDKFLDAVDKAPNVSNIKKMTVPQVRSLKQDLTKIRSLYNNLTSTQKRNSDVLIWEGYLRVKEETIAEMQASPSKFVEAASSLPTVSQINKMNNSQLKNIEGTLKAVRNAYNNLTPAAKSTTQVITWEGYLTEKENAVFGITSILLNREFKYGVESGDTFNSIAKKFQIDVSSLIARNPRVDPSKLYSGQVLYIPNAVVRPMSNPQARDGKHIVYLDAGHGGNDPGAQSSGVREKDLNLTIGRKLTSRLEAMGYTVINVRTNDKSVSLIDRSKMANASNADIFVSLHHNAYLGLGKGIETFYYKYSGYNPRVNFEYHNDGTRIANSVYLSHLIQDNLISATGAHYRRVDGETFSVLRETNIPASLIEFGFMDNPQELNDLLNGSYQNKMVNAVADAIDTYFKTLYK